MNQLIEGLLSAFTISNGLSAESRDQKFEHFVNTLCISPYCDAFPDFNEITTGSEEVGIDGLAIIVNGAIVSDVDDFEADYSKGFLDVQFVFVQAKTSESFDIGEISTTITAIKDFFGSLSLKQGSRIMELYKIQEAIFSQSSRFRSAPDVHIYFATTGIWKNDRNLKAAIKENLRSLEDSPNFSKVSFTPLGAKEIRDRYFEFKRQSEAEIEFSVYIDLPELNGIDQGIIGLVNASKFADAISRTNGDINKSLFLDNLRDSLGNTPTNIEIKRTIEDEPDQFSLRNNGITVVSRKISRGNRGKVVLQDFQIVNGCQTSHVIHASKGQLDPNMLVVLKVISTSLEDITSGIIRGSNISNEVKTSQLWSTTRFHKGLEVLFEQTPLNQNRTIYYERRKGQFAHREEVLRVNQIDTKEFAKLCSSAILSNPHDVTKYASAVEPLIQNGKLFNDEHNAALYVLIAHIGVAVNLALLTSDMRAYRPCRYHFVYGIYTRLIGRNHKINAKPSKVRGDIDQSRALLQKVEHVEALVKQMSAFAEAIRSKRNEDHFRGVAKLKPLQDDIRKWALDRNAKKVPA